MIKHFTTCNADYPEKPEDELPQEIMEISIGTMENPGETLLQCVDCGASEIVTRSRRT
jgi:hypothetical protein